MDKSENLEINKLNDGGSDLVEEILNARNIPERAENEGNNNHQRIVPVGVLFCLVTLYLGMSGIHKCFVDCSEELVIKTRSNLQFENLKDTQILDRLLEYKDICKDLEVFTKDINKTIERKNERGKKKKHPDVETEKNSSGSGSGEGSGSGDCTNTYSKKNQFKKLKNKFSIKLPTNGKNGFHKYNKSTKVKYGKNDKKDLHLNKKNSTAEPIIYLFALIFIYLLLKAASDINQHYKSVSLLQET